MTGRSRHLRRWTGLVALCALCNFSISTVAGQPELLAATKPSFAHPHDLEVSPNGLWLFVADVNHHRIKVLDAGTLETLAVIGNGQLDSPHDVHFDREGRLLVADSGNDRVAIYELDGVKARLVAELMGAMRSPEGVTTDADGNIYVASTGNHQVLKYRDKELIKKVGGYGEAKLQFVRPHDIEMGPDGWLYVGDPGNKRIQILTSDLRYQGVLEVKQTSFNEPKYLALDENNWLYVADQQNNMLRIFDGDRQEVLQISKAGKTTLNNIEGVEVANRRIWISDTYNNRILLFRWTP